MGCVWDNNELLCNVPDAPDVDDGDVCVGFFSIVSNSLKRRSVLATVIFLSGLDDCDDFDDDDFSSDGLTGRISTGTKEDLSASFRFVIMNERMVF